MKTLLKAVATLCAVCLFLSFRVEASQMTDTSRSHSFRITAYLTLDNPIPESVYDRMDKIDYLNIAFINPKTSGKFVVADSIHSIIQKAREHNKKIKVLVSIGGQGHHGYIRELITPDHSQAFINCIVDMVMQGFDGVDLDFEKDIVDANYGDFIQKLALALHTCSKGRKELTAAVGTDFFNPKFSFPAAVWNSMDFINMMSYDLYSENKPQQQAPIFQVDSDTYYWHKEAGVDSMRLGLGLPFYGYRFYKGGFGRNLKSKEIPFSEILGSNYHGTAALDIDTIATDNVIFYNGTTTIRQKTHFAFQHLGGIMIWQLAEDAPGQYSLLDIICSELNRP